MDGRTRNSDGREACPTDMDRRTHDSDEHVDNHVKAYRMCGGIVRITLRQKETMQQHGLVALIEVGSQENYCWALPILLLNFSFFFFFPPPKPARGEPAFLN